MIRLIIACLVISTSAWAGGRAGNGFAIYCDASPSLNIKKGYYSLDYLATLGLGPSRKVKSWAESASRIRRLIQGVLGADQLELYDNFVKNVRNTDYSRKRVWEAAPFGVINLKSQASVDNPTGGPLHKEQRLSNLKSLVTEIPDVCKTASGDVEAIPAVVFQDHFFTGRPKGHLVYKYVPHVLDRLEVTDPLQLSYLYVHEWLWDVSNSEDRNRRVNQLLHSEKIESMSAKEIEQQLHGMGLAITANLDPDTRVALQKTAIPRTRLSFKEMKEALREGRDGKLGDYQVYAAVRDCPKGEACGEWKSVQPRWMSNFRWHLTPRTGSVFWKKDEDWVLELRSRTVDLRMGPGQPATECQIDAGDTQVTNGYCRRMWVPSGDFRPLGQLFAGFVVPELSVYAQADHLWIGGHGKNHNQEARLAFIMPYRVSAPKGRNDPRSLWHHGMLPPGSTTMDNGWLRKVVSVPSFSLPGGGRFSGKKTFRIPFHMPSAGVLRGLRMKALFDRNWDNLSVRAVPPSKSGKYGYSSDASPGVADCGEVFEGAPACYLQLQPGFAQVQAKGKWDLEFTVEPRTSPADLYLLQIVMDVEP